MGRMGDMWVIWELPFKAGTGAALGLDAVLHDGLEAWEEFSWWALLTSVPGITLSGILIPSASGFTVESMWIKEEIVGLSSVTSEVRERDCAIFFRSLIHQRWRLLCKRMQS